MTTIDLEANLSEVRQLAKQLGASARVANRAVRYAIKDVALQHRTAVRADMQREYRFAAGGNAKQFMLNRVQVDGAVRGDRFNPASRVLIQTSVGGDHRSDIALPTLQDGGRLPPGASRTDGGRRSTITIEVAPTLKGGLSSFSPFRHGQSGSALVSTRDKRVTLIKLSSGNAALIRMEPKARIRARRNTQDKAWNRARELTAVFRGGGLLSATEFVRPTRASTTPNRSRPRNNTVLAVLVKKAHAKKSLNFYELADDVAQKILPTVATKMEAILALKRAAGER